MSGSVLTTTLTLRLPGSFPSESPDASSAILYTKGDDYLYYKNDSGTEFQVQVSAGGVDMTQIPILDDAPGGGSGLNAFWVYEGSNSYIRCETTDGDEKVVLGNKSVSDLEVSAEGDIFSTDVGHFNLSSDGDDSTIQTGGHQLTLGPASAIRVGTLGTYPLYIGDTGEREIQVGSVNATDVRIRTATVDLTMASGLAADVDGDIDLAHTSGTGLFVTDIGSSLITIGDASITSTAIATTSTNTQNLGVTGDITVTGTVDGVDISNLALTTNTHGASMIGVEDSAENFANTDVEAVLAELYGAIGGGGGASMSFATWTVPADSGFTWASNDVVADSDSDTISLVAGANITIETDDNLDAVRISASGGGGGGIMTSAGDGIDENSGVVSADLLADGGIKFTGSTPNAQLQVDLGAASIDGQLDPTNIDGSGGNPGDHMVTDGSAGGITWSSGGGTNAFSPIVTNPDGEPAAYDGSDLTAGTSATQLDIVAGTGILLESVNASASTTGNDTLKISTDGGGDHQAAVEGQSDWVQDNAMGSALGSGAQLVNLGGGAATLHDALLSISQDGNNGPPLAHSTPVICSVSAEDGAKFHLYASGLLTHTNPGNGANLATKPRIGITLCSGDGTPSCRFASAVPIGAFGLGSPVDALHEVGDSNVIEWQMHATITFGPCAEDGAGVGDKDAFVTGSIKTSQGIDGKIGAFNTTPLRSYVLMDPDDSGNPTNGTSVPVGVATQFWTGGPVSIMGIRQPAWDVAPGVDALLPQATVATDGINHVAVTLFDDEGACTSGGGQGGNGFWEARIAHCTVDVMPTNNY